MGFFLLSFWQLNEYLSRIWVGPRIWCHAVAFLDSCACVVYDIWDRDKARMGNGCDDEGGAGSDHPPLLPSLVVVVVATTL